MNNKRNCSNCKNYKDFDLFDDDIFSWCKIKNAHIKMPTEHKCEHFQHKWFRKILIRLLSVRGMMGR